MFDETKVNRLSIPQWEAVYRAEIRPGVVSIIAVHDTSRGWALGGCRMAWYDNEATALTDALRLSRGMTFKNAVAELPLGGGKSVIICDPKVAGEERQTILQEFGKFVAWVNRERDVYYTAEDMNTTVPDMHIVHAHTKNIFGIVVDPSPWTAWGVFSSIEFAVDYFAHDLFEGKRGLEGKKVLVQGLGKVGTSLLGYLNGAGASLVICDIRRENIERALAKYPEAEVVDPNNWRDAKVDVFAPCAGGEVVTKGELDNINYKIICGAANNQLQNSKVGKALHRRGVVYCPDYITNMGGVCSIQYLEIEKLSEEQTRAKIARTVRKMMGLTFRTAFRNNLSFNKAVDHAVKKIIWGPQETNLDFSNRELFPLTFSTEPLD
ncbi:Glu/Leu/Phe/Val dehydrogenase [Acanthopleuribacter pedis]|uniref:Glu/Leu/Phe/Val dehydrogenase n=1 Tax=Acanthopleuribacter pedis TaxID=442870 RepID=A0A8J7QDI2_9BACT|nr:Glu/Leu/Phe/Val dehydrogenase [Acanthopleuribacter pedis]MBO1322149.1 Glu/Leu/Phe/Val dehydrogenase [Acanthopleuribacter pedis]